MRIYYSCPLCMNYCQTKEATKTSEIIPMKRRGFCEKCKQYFEIQQRLLEETDKGKFKFSSKTKRKSEFDGWK